jgi:hypothetical protein
MADAAPAAQEEPGDRAAAIGSYAEHTAAARGPGP